jgi:hypothetical protein
VSFLNSDLNHQITLTNTAGAIVVEATTTDGLTINAIFNSDGAEETCSDYYACNYDPSSLCYSYANCDYSCRGCTDSTALNYDAGATINDGSCCYGNNSFVINPDPATNGDIQWYISSFSNPGFYASGNSYQEICLMPGCYYMDAYNSSSITQSYLTITHPQEGLILSLDLSAGWASGYFSFNENSGCTDPYACNFDPQASCSDVEACSYSCYGCTDPAALNYNPDATIDNGTCCHASYSIQSTGSFAYSIQASNGSSQWLHYPEQSEFCLPDGCVSICLSADYGFPEYFDITLSGITDNTFLIDTLIGIYGCIQINQNALAGCTDMYACNFNASANCGDYYLCTYDCYGCTNPDAYNYDINALFDDGSCCLTDFYQIISEGSYTWYASSSDGSFYASGTTNDGSGFCFETGCVNISLYANSASTEISQVQLTLNGVVIESTEFDPSIGYATLFLNDDGIEGCADYFACNYDPSVTCPDNSICNYDCYGCTDVTAINYDAGATVDNGSCCYTFFYQISSTTEAAWNAFSSNGSFFTQGNANDGSGFCFDQGCLTVQVFPINWNTEPFTAQLLLNGEVIQESIFDPLWGAATFNVSNNAISGCTDYYACNFDPYANCPDNTMCNYDCQGCTDPNALNYNPDATIDIGNCCYTHWYNIELNQPANWYVVSNTTGMSASGHYPEQFGFCMDNDCFILQCWTDDGTGVEYTLTEASSEIVASGLIPLSYGYVNILLNNAIAGCTDYGACNYDASAQCSDATLCEYSCYGCTDPEASNFDQDATVSDGSCCYNEWLTVNSNANVYFYVYHNGIYYQGDGTNNSGFCFDGGCFSIHLFPLSDSMAVYSVIDANGNILMQGEALPGVYTTGSYSADGETGGCTDTFSCNYNPNATCDDGSCNMCFGCTDPMAMNFVSSAFYDDGSCFYEAIPPSMGMTVIPDQDTTLYWIMLDVVNTGNGAPYIFQNGDHNYSTVINAAGEYMTGPYSCTETYHFNLVSMAAQMTEYMAVTIEESCQIASMVSEVTSEKISIYPNPASDKIQISAAGEFQAQITDSQGRFIELHRFSGTGEVDVHTYANGVYLAKIFGDQYSETLRFVVRR